MKKILLYLILIMAIGLAGTVAFVSVTGLLKVFAGAGTAGLIFFIGIEVGKIVATSAIHTYGKKIGWFYNTILSIFIVIAMAITSMGIYGFLSSSYKETFSKMESTNSKVELLEKKRDGYQVQLDNVNNEKESVTETITELSKGLSNNVIEYIDPETGEKIRTTSSSTRKALEKQLNRAVERQDVLNAKSDSLSVKVFDIENQILEVKLEDDTASELGPLKYLADVTGMTMDDVMKWFILLLIVIGDPMAVIMVIIFNKVINHGKDDKPNGKVGIGKNPSSGTKFYVDGDSKLEFVSAPGVTVTTDEDVETMNEVMEMVEETPASIIKSAEEKGLMTRMPVPSPERVKELMEEKENKVEEKVDDEKITLEDIKDRNRNFSVTIPARKKSNTIDRIGSNKEVRDGKTDRVIFKKRNK